MNNIKKSRDETLKMTIRILTSIIDDEHLNKISIDFLKVMLLNDALDKLANIWIENGDIFNVAISIEDIKQYSAQPFMHKYKILELIDQLNNILQPKKKQFSLN
jgi:hypothetical protein